MKMSLAEKGMGAFTRTYELTEILIPFAIVFLLTMDPCTPPFLLSTSEQCHEISLMKFGPEIFIVLIEAWLVVQILCAGTPWMFYILAPGIVGLLNYFQLLKG